MEIPEQFRELPTWAAVVGALLGILVVLTGLSMILGIVFAGIAVGIELGSITIGVLAALLGLAIVVVPAIAFVLAAKGGETEPDADDDSDTRLDDEFSDPVAALRDRYMAGEIDEETFEQRVDELLADTDERDTAIGSRPDVSEGETTPQKERER